MRFRIIMEEFIRHLRELLEARFEGATAELEQAYPANKVGGFLLWHGFEGTPQRERQQQLWNMLRAELSREDQTLITAVLTLTNEEMAAMRPELAGTSAS